MGELQRLWGEGGLMGTEFGGNHYMTMGWQHFVLSAGGHGQLRLSSAPSAT